MKHIQKINSIDKLNWPWNIQTEKSKGRIVAYEPMGDIHCMILEIYYQAFIKTKKKDDFRFVTLDNCTVVDLLRLTCKPIYDDSD